MGGGKMVKEGALIKSPPLQSKGVKKWHKRYFILRSTKMLDYYKSEKEKDGLPKGQINLEDCISVNAGLSHKKYDFVFNIELKERNYYLVAENKKDMDDWVKTLCELCVFSHGGQAKDQHLDGTRTLPARMSHQDHYQGSREAAENLYIAQQMQKNVKQQLRQEKVEVKSGTPLSQAFIQKGIGGSPSDLYDASQIRKRSQSNIVSSSEGVERSSLQHTMSDVIQKGSLSSATPILPGLAPSEAVAANPVYTTSQSFNPLYASPPSPNPLYRTPPSMNPLYNTPLPQPSPGANPFYNTPPPQPSPGANPLYNTPPPQPSPGANPLYNTPLPQPSLGANPLYNTPLPQPSLGANPLYNTPPRPQPLPGPLCNTPPTHGRDDHYKYPSSLPSTAASPTYKTPPIGNHEGQPPGRYSHPRPQAGVSSGESPSGKILKRKASHRSALLQDNSPETEFSVSSVPQVPPRPTLSSSGSEEHVRTASETSDPPSTPPVPKPRPEQQRQVTPLEEEEEDDVPPPIDRSTKPPLTTTQVSMTDSSDEEVDGEEVDDEVDDFSIPTDSGESVHYVKLVHRDSPLDEAPKPVPKPRKNILKSASEVPTEYTMIDKEKTKELHRKLSHPTQGTASEGSEEEGPKVGDIGQDKVRYANITKDGEPDDEAEPHQYVLMKHPSIEASSMSEGSQEAPSYITLIPPGAPQLTMIEDEDPYTITRV